MRSDQVVRRFRALRALRYSVGQLFNSDGGWWILALDGILLIPLMFAIFFFRWRSWVAWAP